MTSWRRQLMTPCEKWRVQRSCCQKPPVCCELTHELEKTVKCREPCSNGSPKTVPGRYRRGSMEPAALQDNQIGGIDNCIDISVRIYPHGMYGLAILCAYLPHWHLVSGGTSKDGRLRPFVFQ